jgi:hypothetical protein
MNRIRKYKKSHGAVKTKDFNLTLVKFVIAKNVK